MLARGPDGEAPVQPASEKLDGASVLGESHYFISALHGVGVVFLL